MLPQFAQIDWLHNIGIKTGRDRSFATSQPRAGAHGNHGQSSLGLAVREL